jgi:hypothetical protein
MSRYVSRNALFSAAQFDPKKPAVGVEEVTKNFLHPTRAYVLHTPEGKLPIVEGDWILTDGQGNRYKCEDEEFQLTYIKVDRSKP